ncbi:MAG: iron-containing alcohol dehydrogenase [Acidobacteriota bacterium]
MKFEFRLPTRMVFGPGEISKIGQESKKLGRRPLLVTGRRAMKETGILGRVIGFLENEKIHPVLFDEIEPNPRVSTVDRGAEIARKGECDFILGLGGGSAMDAAKAIAVAAVGMESIWRYIADWKDDYIEPRKALPIGLIPTIAASGSEADMVSVITNWETHEKAVLGGDCCIPAFSIIDPELTFTVSPETTADGGIDIICHVLETYFTAKAHSPVADRFTESIVLTVMENLKKAMVKGDDLEARSALSWASSLALCGIPSAGLSGGFVIHPIEHALSGHYDISHGRGLAILLPSVMRYTLKVRPRRYAQLAERVFHIKEKDLSEMERAELCVQKMVDFLKSVDLDKNLSDLGIGSSKFRVMAEDIIRVDGTRAGYLDNPRKLYKEDIIRILEMSL